MRRAKKRHNRHPVGKTTIRRPISIKTPEQLALMREAGRIVAQALEAARRAAVPGVATADLDGVAEQVVRDLGAIPSFKGYHGYPATLCTSINDEIVHGIPSPQRRLQEGDVVKLDCGAIFQGWQGDAALTVAVGRVSAQAQQLIEATRHALELGIGATQIGCTVGDIGEAIETFALGNGYEVVRQYCGHGIGQALHEEPPVHNFRAPGSDIRLRPGMTICIEPMLNLGTADTEALADGWTVRTQDGALSAHFEHTVAVTPQGPVVLTLL